MIWLLYNPRATKANIFFSYEMLCGLIDEILTLWREHCRRVATQVQ